MGRLTIRQFFLALAAGAITPLLANADVPAEMKILEKSAGTWKVEQTTKTADGSEVKSTGLTTSRMVLGGRFLESLSVISPGGEEAWMIFTFDEKKKKYRSWYFNSKGAHSEWSGLRDEKAKTLTRTADLGRGNTATAVTRFPDEDRMLFSLIGRHSDGKVFVEIDSKFTRQPDARPLARKTSATHAASPAELGTLERLAGKWSDDIVSKVAVWTPEEIRVKSETEKVWFLSGKCIFQESKDAIFVTTYSALEKAVKMWHFNAAGYVHTWTGQWDADGNVLTLKSDLDGDPAVSSVFTQTFTGDDAVRWSANATDREGKVYHQIEGMSKRRK